MKPFIITDQLSIFLILIAFLFCSPAFSQTTINTSFGSYNGPPGCIEIPICVDNFQNVASVSLTFTFNPGVLICTGYSANIALNGGSLLCNWSSYPNKIIFSWYRLTPASLPNGSIVFKLNFNASIGFTNLNWDLVTYGYCQYTDIDGILIPGAFNNGTCSVSGQPNNLSCCSNPTPVSGSTSSLNVVSWNAAPGNPTGYKLYFGTANPPYNLIQTTSNTYSSSLNLQSNTHYYWKAVPYNSSGENQCCPVWDFMTPPAPAPNCAVNPTQTSISPYTNTTLAWNNGGGSPTGYKVYFGTTNSPTNLFQNTNGTSVSVTTVPGTHYYWIVKPYNSSGDAQGCPVWDFVASANHAPVVSNVSFLQQTNGSCKVDVFYDLLDQDGNTMTVSMKASNDNGTTWTYSCPSLTEDIGLNQTSGTNKHIVWDFAADHPNTFSPEIQIKIIADDGIIITACGNPFTDTRDGHVYNTVQIGTQCWMKENLNIGTMVTDNVTTIPHTHCSNNGIIEKYCINNDPANCLIYGGLYDWDEMMQYVTTPGIQGICPTGWHLPAKSEWCTMLLLIDPTVNCPSYDWSGTNAGGKLKEAGYSHWNSPNTGATNQSGFTALGAGRRATTGGSSTDVNITSSYWTSTSDYSDYGVFWYLRYDDARTGRTDGGVKAGFSVRCVKNP